ncbi:AbrB family transcriptional regulator [Bacillus thuringiensis serovar roskildiensis]|uniref:AbrB family transcriptional regulator n=1 Tax=Bacillus thuringiensis serovar sooncheon TaxID=180891 RepID=A0A9Q5SNF6_BACTU|nr:AbrB/MazE/SpoVT family DNA-binding domain-containing protein [Bacillus thuringiensis]MEB9661384.1 AbrB/MazE/SpoVT family DNA-binding domain-containing protein [Bacillus cereus]ARV91373.1 AbrB family transcriptional regulator [Bacillus thuringiensis]OTW70717.1 AbrB family transcriptional regulator [Bacillus thuringiensis serovar coreanensis]OTX53138.1 AbrB family transcriptional regulator [Bacillus thuringiensis serovar sooncheon]OTX56891.1 AbrB family transcriptional regulator [Bacillus thu
MKSTGMIRNLDGLGRIVIPKELRDTFNIKARSPIEIFVEGERIVLQKHKSNNSCVITEKVSEDNISLANNNITLSPEGIEYLLKNLPQYLEK